MKKIDYEMLDISELKTMLVSLTRDWMLINEKYRLCTDKKFRSHYNFVLEELNKELENIRDIFIDKTHPDLSNNRHFSAYCNAYIWILDIDPTDKNQKDAYCEYTYLDAIVKLEEGKDIPRILISKEFHEIMFLTCVTKNMSHYY